MERFKITLALSLLVWPPATPAEQSHNYANGVVPDAMTATIIAEAVLTPIYGKALIQSERPFQAILKDGIWTVEGTLPRNYFLGGVAVVEISKQDGRILRISHGR